MPSKSESQSLRREAEFSARFKELIGDTPYRLVSEQLGIALGTVSAYVHGERTPKTNVVARMADFYGVDPVWVMGYDVPKYKETPGKTEGLSEDRQHIIDWVMRATDDEVRALRAIADQVLALRGK